MLEWVKALSPIIVAMIPVLVAIIKTARKTRQETADKIQAVSTKLDSHIKADEWSEMKQRRVRILRFADDVSRGVRFSKEYWDDIYDDIDDYEKYCKAHEDDYQNNKGTQAMEYIKNKYVEAKELKLFLM